MTRRFTIQAFTAVFLGITALCSPGKSSAQAISEGFDDITTLPASGWSLQNLSSPLGSTGWFQGNASTFSSQNGVANSYIAADQNNTTNGGTISNWLIAPNRTFRNGDVVTFYTRTVAASLRPDRLQVRMSNNGTSTNVGTTATSVGDFTNLLLEINASQTILVYPGTFTQYTVTISGLTAPTSGRVAFRYFVTNGGSALGGNSNYIGIDNFVYTPLICPAFTVNPATLPNPILGTAYSQTLTTANGSGTPAYTVTSGALPAGLTLSPAGVISGTPTTSGTSTFVVTSTDAVTGCSGSRSYTVSIACPTITVNPATLPAGTAGTGYSQTFTQTGAVGTTTYSVSSGTLPAGLTLSSAGVLSGTPTTQGNYNFTVLASASSNCTGSRAYTLSIGCPAMTVTLAPFTAVCSNAQLVTLSGASPAGGTFSGTGVSNGMFNPAFGTQTITYTYTNTNGCSYTATQSFPVNAAPVVSFSPLPALCSDALPFTIQNASPTGGMYYGDSLRNGVFFPSSGTQMIKYVLTNSAGCKDSATQTITIKPAPVVMQDTSFTRLCLGGDTVMLSGATPTGGVYSGVGVDSGRFVPNMTGTYVVGYTVTASNGCTASAIKTITVVDCSVTPPPPPPTGIGSTPQGAVSATSFDCYPNPTTGHVSVVFNQSVKDAATLQVMDIQGRVLEQKHVGSVNGKATVDFELSSYPKGMYLIQVRTNESTATRKIMLQ